MNCKIELLAVSNVQLGHFFYCMEDPMGYTKMAVAIMTTGRIWKNA